MSVSLGHDSENSEDENGQGMRQPNFDMSFSGRPKQNAVRKPNGLPLPPKTAVQAQQCIAICNVDTISLKADQREASEEDTVRSSGKKRPAGTRMDSDDEEDPVKPSLLSDPQVATLCAFISVNLVTFQGKEQAEGQGKLTESASGSEDEYDGNKLILEEIGRMPCIQLREELAKLGLDTAGKKAALAERLYAAHVASSDSGSEEGSVDEAGGDTANPDLDEEDISEGSKVQFQSAVTVIEDTLPEFEEGPRLSMRF